MDTNTLLKNTARSLYLSAKILPRKIRRTFYCGYLICRIADTIADTTLIETSKRLTLIRIFPEMIEKQNPELIQEFKNAVPEQANIYKEEKELLDNIDICLSEYNSLSEMHKKFILDVVHAVCSGMEWDLSFFPSEDSGLLKAVPNNTRTELYCNYMGGEPGVFWARLLLDTKKDNDFLENARHIGNALQITNILRDIAGDVKIGRSYIPMTDLTANDLMPQDLLDKKSYRKLRPIIYKWINWGVDNLLFAPDFYEKIPRYRFGARASVAWPVLWSLDTFFLLASCKNLLDPSKRQKIPRKTIYLTILASPLFCVSSHIFRWAVNYKAMKVKKLIKEF